MTAEKDTSDLLKIKDIKQRKYQKQIKCKQQTLNIIPIKQKYYVRLLKAS